MNKQLALVGLSTLSLLASGCGHKASGQTVAVVNGEEISISELNDELASANLPPNIEKKAATAQILQNVIDRHLLAQKAEADGLDKSPEFISKLRRMREQLLISMVSDRQSGSAKLPDQGAIDAFINANPQMFTQRTILSLDQIQFDAPKDPTVLNKLKDAHTLDQVAAALSAAGVPFTKGSPKVDTAGMPRELVKRIDALPPTEPFIIPIAGKLFASVVANRQAAPTPPEDQNKIALQMIRRKAAGDALGAQLKSLRSSAKIDYQSGYQPPAKPAA